LEQRVSEVGSRGGPQSGGRQICHNHYTGLSQPRIQLILLKQRNFSLFQCGMGILRVIHGRDARATFELTNREFSSNRIVLPLESNSRAQLRARQLEICPETI
jgi:hypothetical protein